MLAFFGDSHSRQFQSRATGRTAFVSFSGATIKGLRSDTSKIGHGAIIRHFAAAPVKKTVLIMLGSVDIDVTFYRKLALADPLDEATFFAARTDTYVRFLRDLTQASGRWVKRLCVLAPQITPLPDATFVQRTASMAKVGERDLRTGLERVDWSHRARCARQIRFNDALERAMADAGFASVYRIDRAMTVDGTLIADPFRPDDPADHHARERPTLTLWKEVLSGVVPRYAEWVARRAAQRAAGGDDAGEPLSSDRPG